MKHVSTFNTFLKNHVNLNRKRLDRAQESVSGVTGYLREHLNGYQGYSWQGSYAHQTIIRPVGENDEFDADIQIRIRDAAFNPDAKGDDFKDYVDILYSTLRKNETYADKVSRQTRCVTVNYTGDFHLDAVPCIEHEGHSYICNRKNKCYEETDGNGYKNWLNDKSNHFGNNFKKVTRLLKFLRDHKDNFSVKSILLTTLLGNEVYEGAGHEDVPDALRDLSGRLNNFLLKHPSMPIVKNPVLPNENFNRHWDERKYSNFRKQFNVYFKKIDAAYHEKDRDRSIDLWCELFGEGFRNCIQKAAIAPATVAATRPYAAHDG